MTNFNSLSLQNLNHQKASWQNLPTKAIRIPECFEEAVLRYVRSLDNGLHPISFEDIIVALNSLDRSEIEQLKLAVDCISSSLLGEHQSAKSAGQKILSGEFRAPSPSPTPNYVLSENEMAIYKAKFGFVPSNYQLAIIEWILNEQGHGCCNAVAGSGALHNRGMN